METYNFQARWKEELVCSTPAKSFVLKFPMGNPTVYFPNECRWKEVGPSWATEDWPALHEQLRAWCKKNNVELMIDETAKVY